MNILIDNHHSGLLHSMQLLFEERLGHQLYTQIGMEWYEKEYWNVYPNIGTAKQYLERNSQPLDGTPSLTELAWTTPRDCPYDVIYDSHHDWPHRAITFDQFEKMDIDIVIASIPQHIKPFKELAKMKGAKFVFQMGNAFLGIDWNEIPNLMVNTLPKDIPTSCHYIQYHQEIDSVFQPSTIVPQHAITSFINVYHDNGGFEDYMALKSLMPSYEFKSYGGQCQDGVITGIDKIAAIMQRSQFGFHVKRGGDGFGHILYDWFASGRPIITRISDYKDKLGGELLEHKVTCLDLDTCNYDQICDIIVNMPPLHYVTMCQNVRDRFDKYVNYEKEAKDIEKFLEELQ